MTTASTLPVWWAWHIHCMEKAPRTSAQKGTSSDQLQKTCMRIHTYTVHPFTSDEFLFKMAFISAWQTYWTEAERVSLWPDSEWQCPCFSPGISNQAASSSHSHAPRATHHLHIDSGTHCIQFQRSSFRGLQCYYKVNKVVSHQNPDKGQLSYTQFLTTLQLESTDLISITTRTRNTLCYQKVISTSK